MIFGTIQHCFVLNTAVNSILNKFVMSLAPPSNKVNNSVLYLQCQASPQHSDANMFKITAPICTIFDVTEHRGILKVLVTSFSSTA